METHYRERTGFMLRKHVLHPGHSEELAEAIGIILGDGGVSRYQVTVAFNWVTDQGYARFVAAMFNRLFGVVGVVKRRPPTWAGYIVFSGRALVEYLAELGIGEGSKVRRQAGIPDWVLREEPLRLACVRGLLDTDGCVYEDRHAIGGRDYRNPALNFSNRSVPLRTFVAECFERWGWHPLRGRWNVSLRRLDEVAAYFAVVGSHNPKHLRRWTEFTGQNGERRGG